jgi:hypothetical protein
MTKWLKLETKKPRAIFFPAVNSRARFFGQRATPNFLHADCTRADKPARGEGHTHMSIVPGRKKFARVQIFCTQGGGTPLVAILLDDGKLPSSLWITASLSFFLSFSLSLSFVPRGSQTLTHNARCWSISRPKIQILKNHHTPKHRLLLASP